MDRTRNRLGRKPATEITARITKRSADTLPFGNSNRLPRSFTAHVDDPDSPVLVSLRFHDGGPFHATAVSVYSRDLDVPLLDRDIREAPIGAAIDAAIAAALLKVEHDAHGNETIMAETNPAAMLKAIQRYHQELLAGRLGRRPLDSPTRTRILELWNQEGDHPGAAQKIADIAGVSRSTVYRVIRQSKSR